MKKRRIPVVDRVRSVFQSSAMVLVESRLGEPASSLRPFSEFLFDERYYGSKYPDAALEVRERRWKSLRSHYEKRGHLQGFRPSAFFVPSVYALDPRASYPTSAAGQDPVSHYLKFGCAMRASPHWLFDEPFYLSEYADVARAVETGTCASGFHHFLTAGVHERRRPHPLFSPALYGELSGGRADGPDFLHYARTGAFQGRVTSGLFDPEWYASTAMDVVPHVGEGRTFDSLLHHFVQFGMREGRPSVPDFDAEYYLRRYEVARRDVEEGRCQSAIQHFIEKGARLAFSPNRYFDSEHYLSANPEVGPEVTDLGLWGPFEHFMLLGRQRGLRCNPPLAQALVDEDQAKIAYAKRARTSALLSRSRPRPLSRPAPDSPPDVSIVVPVQGQADYTFHLLADLSSRKYGFSLEIIVVDNASADETRDLSAVFPDVKVLRNETNVGFPAACNQGYRASAGQIVVFANNDIEVLPGSLDAMLQLFDAAPDIAVIGPRIIRMHGRLQEAGGAVYPDGSTAGHGRNDDPDAPRYGWVQDVHYCSAVFLAIRRAALEEVGGFDERYSPGYYEEVDLCARMWAAGRRVVVEPAAVVYHFEHASFAQGRPAAAAAVLMHRHRRRFAETRQTFLSACTDRLTSSPVGSVGHSPERKTVLLIEDFLPLPAIGSGYPRANRIVHALSDMGYRVVVYALFRHPAGTWLDARRWLPPVEVHYDDEAPNVLGELLETREFEAVWLCRTHNLQRVLTRLLPAKSLRKRPVLVLDTEAISANRTAALRALNDGREASPAEAEHVRAELLGAEEFDCVVAVSDIEERQIARAVSRPRVVRLSHEAPVQEGAPDFAARSGFLFVGSVHAELSPNHEGLSWFIREVWPEMRRRDPALWLTVAGYWDPRVPRPPFLHADGVRFLGEVADLGPLYAAARVFVAPIRFAAGIPLKVQEAVAQSVPCVITRLLAAQIGFRHGEEAIVASALDPDEFGAACLELHRSSSLWTRVRAGGLARAREDWSKARFVEGVRAALSGAESRGHLLS